MKRICMILLAAALMLCGCAPAALPPEETQTPTEATVPATEGETAVMTLPTVGQQSGEISLGRTGRIRANYQGNVSSVRYITGVDQLPEYSELAGYDEAYFENGALLIVMESVSSGSVQVDIQSVDDGVVTLSHTMSGDVGTTDMATWLLWAEVDAGLDCTWSVANPALKPNTALY